MIRSWSASPWSSKQMVFMPVSGSSVKIPSVLISRAVGGLGGIRQFRNVRSFLSHCRKVGICWQNFIRSSASYMPWRTLSKHSSWISLIGRRGSTLITSQIFSFMFSLCIFTLSGKCVTPSVVTCGLGCVSTSGISSIGFPRSWYLTLKEEVHLWWTETKLQ